MLAALALAVSCRGPTEVTLRITTGEQCSDLAGVQIVVGPDQSETQRRFEIRFTNAVTHDCDANGFVGTLVVAPGGESATVVVAAGVRVGALRLQSTACANPANVKSCIVARRTFSFLAHTSLTLPIRARPALRRNEL